MTAVTREAVNIPHSRIRVTRTPNPRAVSSPASYGIVVPDIEQEIKRRRQGDAGQKGQLPPAGPGHIAEGPETPWRPVAHPSAKNCRNMVPAVNKAPRATPAKIMVSGLAPRRRDTATINREASMEKANAEVVVTSGLVMATAPHAGAGHGAGIQDHGRQRRRRKQPRAKCPT